MFGRFIALGAIRVESLCRKRLTWAVLLPAPILQYKKCPFQSDIRKSFANSSERVCEMGWKAPDRKRVLAEFEFGPVCGLELELVAGWSALWSCRHLAGEWSCRPATSSQVQSATSRGRGGRCRQGEDFFSPLAKKSEKLSQFLKTVCREWDGGWKIEMCHIKGVLKRWQLVPEPWTWQLKQLLG